MQRLWAGCCSCLCVLMLASSASAQRIPQPIGISAKLLATARPTLRRPAPPRDIPPKQVAIEARFLEVDGEYRKFLNWKDVSGNDPSVLANETRDWAAGINIIGGVQLGSLPIWAQAGGYFSTGLETKATLDDGETIHGKINSYGLGAGARLVPYRLAAFAFYLWAMGYYDWDDGDFDIVNGVTRSENRIHNSLMGDYGVGAVYLIEQVMGINFGISYNGLFDKKNADENFRIKLGLILNPPREIIY